MTDIKSYIDSVISGAAEVRDKEAAYLSRLAPNVIEWVTGSEYWNVTSTFEHWRQYQILRDLFNLRCRICNPNTPEAVDCWGKSRTELESEVLLVWSEDVGDFVCPKCRTTQYEFFADGLMRPYNEAVVIAGMRSGKSYLGGHIGGYIEHCCSALSVRSRGYLQRYLRQEKSEWFEVTFAASTATQAQQTIYAKYREMRAGSPWMNRYVGWVREQERRQIGQGEKWSYRINDDAILDGWAKVRYNRVASDSSGIAGKTRIMSSIDEWARLMDTEGTRSSLELYRVLNQSLKTVRANVDSHKLPPFLGMMVNVTSPLAQDDPAMQTFIKATDGTLSRTYGWKGPTWKFNPQLGREAFDEEFAKDPVGAERDYGANPPNAETPFVDDPIRFWKTIDWNKKPVVSFTETYLTDKTEKSYIGAEVAKCDLDIENTYYLFGDAGLNWDSFALVGGHPEWMDASEVTPDFGGKDVDVTVNLETGRIKPPGMDVIWPEELGTYVQPNVGPDGPQWGKRLTGRIGNPDSYQGQILVTVIDFATRIIPSHSRDIWFQSIVNVVADLKSRIRIASIFFDHWNSPASIQQIRDIGIPADTKTLRPESFMSFLRMAYNGRLRMLPPSPDDLVAITRSGSLQLGTSQELMSGSSIALVELMKLNRSADLRRFFNPAKGVVRGRDSDDIARCVVGVHQAVQDSIVDDLSNSKKRQELRKRQQATESILSGGVFNSGRGF